MEPASSKPTSIVASDFVLASIQAVGFTPDEGLSVPRFVKRVLPGWGEYDGEPTIWPPANGLPPEVPRVTLQNMKGNLKCEVAASRIAISWWRETASQPIDLAAFLNDASHKMLTYSSEMETRLARLAAVLNWVVPTEAPAPILARHFCRPELLSAPLNRPESFELHSHKKFKMGDLVVNSWVRCKTAIMTSAGTAQPIVLVEQDLNTLGEDVTSREFSDDEVNQFFSTIPAESTAILRLYFAGEQ
jgi:hypothetical protein